MDRREFLRNVTGGTVAGLVVSTGLDGYSDISERASKDTDSESCDPISYEGKAGEGTHYLWEAGDGTHYLWKPVSGYYTGEIVMGADGKTYYCSTATYTAKA